MVCFYAGDQVFTFDFTSERAQALWCSFPFTKTYGNLKKLGSAYARDVVCD